MKIVVLAGGLSTERDVSLTSGASICRALRERGHKAILLDVFMGMDEVPENPEEIFDLPDGNLGIASGISTAEPDLAAIKASRKDQSDCFLGPNVIDICRLSDMNFLGLHGGYGEDGRLQAAFDILGIRYTGPDSLGNALAMDKSITKQIFNMCGVATPAGTWLYEKDKDKDLAELGLSIPVVVKACAGGSSIGVYICNTMEEYREAVETSFAGGETCLVLEQYIKGREFACGIIDGKALPVIEIIPKNGWFDYANKYQAGGSDEVCPADIPVETEMRMRAIAEKAFAALKLRVYSRADFLLDDKGDLYCLEVNTLPGMTPASLLPKEAAAAGISYGELCELIIEKSLDARYR